jgi:hypothetical protein
MNMKIKLNKANVAWGTPPGAPAVPTSEALVHSYMQQINESHQIEKLQVCVIGSGNWGSTAAKIIGENILTGEASRFSPLRCGCGCSRRR